MLRRLSLFTLFLLALLLPFEMERPWFQLGPIVVTNIELLLVLTLAMSSLLWWKGAVSPETRSFLGNTWQWLWLLFLAALILSSLLAPEFRGNAFKATLRTASGMALALAVTANVWQGGGAVQSRLRLVAGALVAGGLLAATIGLAEIYQGADFPWLAPFRAIPTVAGPFLRLSGTFDYANQAAMYIEATLPLLLAACYQLVGGLRGNRPGGSPQGTGRLRGIVLLLVALVALVVYTQAAIYTFSRASYATLLVVNMALAILLWLRGSRMRVAISQVAISPETRSFRGNTRGNTRDRQQALFFAGLAVLVVALTAANMILNPNFRLRLGSESDNDWYLARLQVPATLRLEAGEELPVVISATNEGAFTWRSSGTTPVNLAARWVQPRSGLELTQRPRWPLSTPVPPGETITQEVILRAPQAGGEYELIWDMVQEHVIWFGAKTGREATSSVEVSGDATTLDRLGSGSSASVEELGYEESFEEAWTFSAPIPGRLTLWRAAWDLWRQRPLLGIGLDNFRLLYGRSLDYSLWNTSVHTNNWMIETLVSTGLLGALPFVVWLVLLVVDIGRQTLGVSMPSAEQERTPSPGFEARTLPRKRGVSGELSGSNTMWQTAIASGLLAFIVHGLLDYFLLFNATALLFWMLVGLWLVARAENRPPTPL
jgi:hypothetical protein